MKVILFEFISVWDRGVLHEAFWWAHLMEIFDFEDLKVDGTTILKWTLKSRMGRRALNVVYYRDKCLALVNKVVSMKLSLRAGNSLTSPKIQRTLLRGINQNVSLWVESLWRYKRSFASRLILFVSESLS
jgi:hypothetical protein